MSLPTRVSLVFFLLVFFAVPTLYADASHLPPGIRALPATPAPALSLQDQDGRAYTLKDSRGRWVFVHFWASWCGPCRKEMPTIQRLSSQMKGQAMDLRLVNTAEDEDTVFSFLGVAAPDLSTLMDHDGQVTQRWQPRGLPSTYLVDPEGFIRYQALGGRAWDQPAYLAFLKHLLQNPSPP